MAVAGRGCTHYEPLALSRGMKGSRLSLIDPAEGPRVINNSCKYSAFRSNAGHPGCPQLSCL
jgi:hypothetical protein